MQVIFRNYIIAIFFLSGFVLSAQNQVPKFQTVKIGNQEWMTMNWDFKTPKSFYYNNDSTLDKKYGRLYYYSNAVAAAPPGWHLPTLDEWWELINYFGGPNKAAALMLSSDSIGLNLVVGGYKSANISGDGSDLYGFIDKYAFYWTSTADEEQTAFAIQIIPASASIDVTTYRRANGFSVRYVKDR